MRRVWLLLLALALASCSEQVGYQVGFVTREVTGKVEAEGGAAPLVLVRMHLATFVESSQGRIHQPRAKLAYPDPKGVYLVYMEDEVDAVDLYYFAKGHKTAQASFSRTLGVKAYQFDVKLKTDPNPKNGYYLGLKPLLSGYITEPRYQLPPKDQLFLGQWMDQAEKDFYQVTP